MQTNLNFLFQQLLPNFAHLVTIEEQIKADFLDAITTNYDINNPKIYIFYQSCHKSDFVTIKLSNDRQSVLFNQ